MADAPQVVIVGHPKSGKSTLLRGLKELDPAGASSWIELPGVHMLGRNTESENEVYDRLVGSNSSPDGIVALADARNLSQQLFLVSQLIDLRLPIVVGVTGMHAAAGEGILVAVDRLGAALGVPAIQVDPEQDEGIKAIIEQAQQFPGKKNINRTPHWRPSVALADAFHHLDRKWGYNHLSLHTGARFIEGLRLLTVPKAVEEYVSHPAYSELEKTLEAARKMLEDKNERWTSAEVMQRHNGLGQILQSVVQTEPKPEKAEGRWWSNLFK